MPRSPGHVFYDKLRHDQVFTWVLACLAEHGLIQGKRIGADAPTMEAALRTIVRCAVGET